MVTEWSRSIALRLFGVIALLVISQLVALSTVSSDPLTYLWYALSVMLAVVGFAYGRTFGLVASVIAIFLIGSYDVLQIFVLASIATTSAVDVVWFLLFPLTGFVSGELGDTVRAMGGALEERERQDSQVALMNIATGWLNRRGFFVFLGVESLRDERRFQRRVRKVDVAAEWGEHLASELSPFEQTSVLLLQINHFEDLAMIYGVAQQTAILTWCMQQLASVSRKVDVHAELAPGLLVVILSETDVTGAQTVTTRLRDIIREYRWSAGTSGGRQIQLDIRCGSATMPQDGTSPETVLEAAMLRLRRDFG